MVKIKLTQGQVAIVDDCDAHLAGWKWQASLNRTKKSFYVQRSWKKPDGKTASMKFHHAILGHPLNGLCVDHLNGNPLDNRRENLRIVTNRENHSNKIARRQGTTASKYVGVSWQKQIGKWVVQIRIRGKKTHIGVYRSEEEAGMAYQDALERMNKIGPGEEFTPPGL